MEGKRPHRGDSGFSKDQSRGGHGSSRSQDYSESTTHRMADLDIKPREPIFQLPLRPGYGIAGTPRQLLANYFQLEFKPGLKLHKYSIEISPEARSPGKKRQLIRSLLQNSFFRRDDLTVATNFEAFLISPQPLDLGPFDSKRFHVPYYNDLVEHQPRPDAVTYDVIVTYEKELPLQHLLNYLSSTDLNRQFDQKEDVVQALNAIVARIPSADHNIISAGRNSKFFPKDNFQDLGELLRVCRGYYASVRSTVGGLLVNIHTCTSAFHRERNLLVLMRLLRDNGMDLAPFLYGLQFSTRYLKVDKGPNKGEPRPMVRTIDGVGKSAQDTKFPCLELDRESEVSVEYYFKEKHGITLQAPGAPLIAVKGANPNIDFPIWIPPELCEVLPFQLYRRVVPPDLTSRMIEVALLDPVQTAQRILGQGLSILGIASDQAELRRFGLRVQKKMITVEGRVLAPPRITFGKHSETPTNGSWNLKGKEFYNVGKPIKWTFLTMFKASASELQKPVDSFKKALLLCGLKNARLSPREGFTRQPHIGENGLVTLVNHAKQEIEKAAAASVDVLLVILPKHDIALYSEIKHAADISFGIHTVCAVKEKFYKQGLSFFANLTLKANLKAGGINQSLQGKDLGILEDGKTIVIGYDVTHPGPQAQKKTPSIAGMVASIDGKYAQWAPSVALQENAREEMVKGPLIKMIVERLTYWEKCNGSLPSQILIYRDGVSETQYRQVLMYELSGIRTACQNLYKGGKLPKISILVVGKRHHTRFFTTNAKGGVLGNPKPGTVLDKGITMEKGNDFYLQAHHALQGTARPIHYIVIHDEIGLGVDELQKTTHNLSYMFGRATTAVSVCTPAYFADLLCDRARCYLRKELNGLMPKGSVFDRTKSWNGMIHPKLENTMFYT